MSDTSRRKLITTAVAGAAGVSALTMTNRVGGGNNLLPPDAGGPYGCGHTLTYVAHRLLIGDANAREFDRSQVSKAPHPKGVPPKGEEFAALRAGGFKDWKLSIDGLIDRPATFTIDDLKSFPSRTQVTQLICEEGWSYIAEWTGVPLAHILERAGVHPEARFVVNHSMDNRFDAIDMADARHGQTLVGYGMNQTGIPVGHGGPLRLLVPRQLGYKNRKFLDRLTVTASLDGYRIGKAYSFFAGI